MLHCHTPFFHLLVGHTILPVNFYHPAMNSVQYNTMSCLKLDIASPILNCRILQHEHHPVLIPRQLNGAVFYIRASDFSCSCSCILRSTIKIPIASLDVCLCFPLTAQGNMLTVTLLRHFVPFYLNTFVHISMNFG